RLVAGRGLDRRGREMEGHGDVELRIRRAGRNWNRRAKTRRSGLEASALSVEPMTESRVESPRRPIRSYVVRQGRFSPAQQRARELLLPRFGVAFAAAPLDFEVVFGRKAPTVLEIGFGMGGWTAPIAGGMPGQDGLVRAGHGPGA